MNDHDRRRAHIDRLLEACDIRLDSRADVLEQARHGFLPARTYVVVLKYTTGILPAFSNIDDNSIFLNEEDYGDEIPYLVALHEIGHLLTKEQSTKYLKRQIHVIPTPRDEIQSEELAWDWANKNAIEITPIMETWQKYALGTYKKYEEKLKEMVASRRSAKAVRCQGPGSQVSLEQPDERAFLSDKINSIR